MASSSSTPALASSSASGSRAAATLTSKGKARAVSPDDEMLDSGLHTPPASPLASSSLAQEASSHSLLIPTARGRPPSIFSGYPTPESPPRSHPAISRLSPEPIAASRSSAASSRRTSDAESTTSAVSTSPSTRPIFGHLRDALDEVDLGDPFGLDLLSAPLTAAVSSIATPGLIGTSSAPSLPRLGARRRPYASGASLAASMSRNAASGLADPDHQSIFSGLSLRRGIDDDDAADHMARTASSSGRAAPHSVKRSFEQAALSPSSSPSRTVLGGPSSATLAPVTGDDSLDTSTSSMTSASSHLYASPSAGRSSRASNKRQRADSGASSSFHGSVSFHEARSNLSHGEEAEASEAERAAPRSSTSSMHSGRSAATRVAVGLDFDLDVSESERGEDSDAEHHVTPHFAPALGSPSTRLAGDRGLPLAATGTLTPSRISHAAGDGDTTMSWTSSVAGQEAGSSPAANPSSVDGMTIRRRAGPASRGGAPHEAPARDNDAHPEQAPRSSRRITPDIPLPSARRHLGWPSDGASTPTTADSMATGASSGLRRRVGRSREDQEAAAATTSPPPVAPQSLSDRLAELQAEVDSTVSELRSWRERNSALIERLRRSEAPPAEPASSTSARPVPVPAPSIPLSAYSLRPPPSFNAPTPPPPRPEGDLQSTADTTVSQLNRWRERSRQLIEQLMENEDSFGLQQAAPAEAAREPPSSNLSGLAARRGMSVASRLTPSLRTSVPVGRSSEASSLWGELGRGAEEPVRADATPLAGRRSGALGASGRLRGPTRRRNEDWLTSADESSAATSGRRSTVSSLYPAASSSAASSSTSLELPPLHPTHRDAIDVPRLPDIRSRSPFSFDFASDDVQARPASAATQGPPADEADGSSSRRLRLRTLRLASRLTTNARSNSTDSQPSQPNDPPHSAGPLGSFTSRYPYRSLADDESSEESSRDPFSRYRELSGPPAHGLRPLRTPARLARRERLRDAIAAAAAAEEGLETTTAPSSASSTTDSLTAPSHTNAIDDLVEQVARRRARRLLSSRPQHAERSETQPFLGASRPPQRSLTDLTTTTTTTTDASERRMNSSMLLSRIRRNQGLNPIPSDLLEDSASDDETPATLGHGESDRPVNPASTAALRNRFISRMYGGRDAPARTGDVEHQPTLSRHLLANSILAASESRRGAGSRSTASGSARTQPPWRPQSSASSTSSTTAASSTAGNAASSAASSSSSTATAAQRWDRLLDSGFGAFGSLWDSGGAATSLSNSLGLPRLLLAELGAGDVAGNPANYMNDDEWLGRDSYEGLLRLSERIGDVKPKHTPAHVIDALPTCQHAVWLGGSCEFEEPEVAGKGKGVDRGEARSRREEAAALVVDRDQQCPICLEEYAATSMLMSAPCNHAFHEACLRTWLASSQSCPMCRQNVQPPSAAAARHEASLILPELFT